MRWMNRVAPAAAMALAMVMSAGVAQANEGVVEAVGEAQIKGNDKLAAKQKAVADGLKKCIEQVVGISIKSEFSSQMQETVRGNQSEFNAKVAEARQPAVFPAKGLDEN